MKDGHFLESSLAGWRHSITSCFLLLLPLLLVLGLLKAQLLAVFLRSKEKLIDCGIDGKLKRLLLEAGKMDE